MLSKSDIYVIILAAGRATRLKPFSNKTPKPLINIIDTPLISLIIKQFQKAGFNKFAILNGYKGKLIKSQIKKHNNIKIEFIKQEKIVGMADAILECLNHLKEKNYKGYFVTAADILFEKKEIEQMYDLFLNTGSNMVLSLMCSKDEQIAKGHGNVGLNKNYDLGNQYNSKNGLIIRKIIEKPRMEEIMSEFYSLPLYLFDNTIYKYLTRVTPSERGEKEFQDAIKEALRNGDQVRGINIINEMITIENVGNYHITYIEDILKMNARFLKKRLMETENNDNITISAPVHMKSVKNCGKEIKLGPNTVIGNDCEINDNSQVRQSIISEKVKIGKNVILENVIVEENLSIPDMKSFNSCYIYSDDEGKIKTKPFNFNE